jgi:hypothetical protein
MRAPTKKFLAGSGEQGCLYDCVEECDSYLQAVAVLQFRFGLGRDRLKELKREGYLRLNARRDGAEYCEIAEVVEWTW